MNRTADMREILHLMESNIEEDLGSIKNKFLSSMGSQIAKGRMDHDKLVKKMSDLWKQHLGRTGIESNEINLAKFLINQIGFSMNHIREIFNMSNVIDPTTNSETKSKLSTKQIHDVFTNAAKLAFANNLIGKSNNNYYSGTRNTNHSEFDKIKSMMKNDYNNDEDVNDTLYQEEIKKKKKMMNNINRLGLDTRDVADLKHMATTTNFSSIKDIADIKQLAVIGYAFLKNS